MTTAEEARRRTLNAIKEKYQEQLKVIDGLICSVCDEMEHEVVATFKSAEDRNKIKFYLNSLGYNTSCGIYTLTISWRSVKSNEEQL